MRKFILALVTVVVLLIANTLAAKLFKLSFLELSFITGVLSSILVGLFSSEGGPLTGAVDAKHKFLMHKETRTEGHFTRFYMNVPFIVCICYTIIFAIVNIVMYWEYFSK